MKNQKDTLLLEEYQQQVRLQKYVDTLLGTKEKNGDYIVLEKKTIAFDVNSFGYAIEKNGTIIFHGHNGEIKKFKNIGEQAACQRAWHLHATNIHFGKKGKRILVDLTSRKHFEIEIPGNIESTCCEGGIISCEFLQGATLDKKVTLFNFSNPKGIELYRGDLSSWNVGPDYLAIQLEAEVDLKDIKFNQTFLVPAVRMVPFSDPKKATGLLLPQPTEFFYCGKHFIVSFDRSKGTAYQAELRSIDPSLELSGVCWDRTKFANNWFLHNFKFGVCNRDTHIITTENLISFSGEGYRNFSIKDIQLQGKHNIHPKVNDVGYYEHVNGEVRLYPFTYEWYDYGKEQISRIQKSTKTKAFA